MSKGKNRGARGAVNITTNLDNTSEEKWKPVIEVKNFESGVEEFWWEWSNPHQTRTLSQEVVWNLDDGTRREAICWHMMDWETNKTYAMRILAELLNLEKWRNMNLIIRWYKGDITGYAWPYGKEPPVNHKIIQE